MEQITLFPDRFVKGVAVYSSLFTHKGIRLEVLRQPFYHAMDLHISTQGKIKLRCARSTPVRKIREFIDQHIVWINSTLEKHVRIKKRYPEKKMKSGERFPFLGKSLVLVYEYCVKNDSGFSIDGNQLIYRWSHLEQVDKQVVRKNLTGFYKKNAKDLFYKVVNVWADRMGLAPTGISIRAQKTLWGSCSTSGALSLNFRLIGAPLGVLEYVIIHELSHLKYLNHSKAFWSYVSKWDGNYRKKEQWLKERGYSLDFLQVP